MKLAFTTRPSWSRENHVFVTYFSTLQNDAICSIFVYWCCVNSVNYTAMRIFREKSAIFRFFRTERQLCVNIFFYSWSSTWEHSFNPCGRIEINKQTANVFIAKRKDVYQFVQLFVSIPSFPNTYLEAKSYIALLADFSHFLLFLTYSLHPSRPVSIAIV